jgi:uncharacterized protein with HEPN domain
MSERNILLLLEDIKTAITKILRYTQSYTFEMYEADDKTREACERNFEIIGEASARIPNFYKEMHQDVEWRIIKDFRNVIIHEYFGVNNYIIWETIIRKLPQLLQNISTLINEEKN